MSTCFHRIHIFAALVLLSFTGLVSAQGIEIKGMAIGMSKAEVEKMFPTWQGFTIAGVSPKFSFAPVEYFDGKLDAFHFFFDAKSFDDVAGAVKGKYPNIKCVEDRVGNAMGATFNQINCSLSDDLAVLSLQRFVSDVKTSSLTLTSKRKLKEFSEKSQQKKKDI